MHEWDESGVRGRAVTVFWQPLRIKHTARHKAAEIAESIRDFLK